VTTFRSDLSYSDGRHPDGVRFGSAGADALRRDFTINGMFYDPFRRELIDTVGGREDLARGVIRTIGDPDRRFGEDYLRMIRAVRFAVRLGFRIAPRTAEAVKRHAGKISQVSGERIFDELSKMLGRDSAAEALEQLDRLDLAEAILPELYEAAAWRPAVRRVRKVARRTDPRLALAALLCDLPAGTIRQIVRRWGASNELRDALCWMAAHRDDWRTASQMRLSQLKRLMAREDFPRLRRLWSAREQLQTGKLACARRISRRVNRIAPHEVRPRPFVDGADLQRMGLDPGKRLGQLLRALYDEQLDGRLRSRREALGRARQWIVAGQ